MSVGEDVGLKYSTVIDCFDFLPDTVDDVCKRQRGVVGMNVDGVNSLHNSSEGGGELKRCFDEWDDDVGRRK